MTPTTAELVALLKAKGCWPPWMYDVKGWQIGYDPDDAESYDNLWEAWIATAEASWLPAIFAIALDPPIIREPYGGVAPHEWLMNVIDVVSAIALKAPMTVVNTLLSTFDENNQSEVLLYIFPYVMWAIWNAYDLPSGPDSKTGVALIKRMLDALAPLVNSIDDKPDHYVVRLVLTVGGMMGNRIYEQFDSFAQASTETAQGQRFRAHGLLQQIAANTPESRVAVYKVVSESLNPPPRPQFL